MRRLWILLLAGWTLQAAAGAATSEAVMLRAGPLETGDSIAPVWMAKCPFGQRLVGVREHLGDGIESIEAVCVVLRNEGAEVAWLSQPLVPLPPEPPPARVITREVQEDVQGTVLRADSAGVTRQRGSRAVLITVTAPVADEQTFPAPRPTVDFVDSPTTQDLLCPANSFVKGLRLGTQDSKRGTEVAALQLICADVAGREAATVGDWPAQDANQQTRLRGKSKRSAEASTGLRVQRIECGGAVANPHDGAAAMALFGSAEDRRIQTIGLSCARDIDPRGPAKPLYVALRRAVDAVPRLLGLQKTYERPLWFDGAQLAVCAPGALDTACAQASADRYCALARSYDRATGYVVGKFAQESVAATGERCARGTCRAFRSITCGFAKG